MQWELAGRSPKVSGAYREFIGSSPKVSGACQEFTEISSRVIESLLGVFLGPRQSLPERSSGVRKVT
ncbi:hypothetical protein B296_00043354 [Ensete ventricosum]|uniref:Uncharacterized protein n=1 Tax=Ensete ventricosum TaxID=4639 RepID=A0A426XM47_ENSVE|nr:hypothetical protein B296_00043354 [Ensete ventricosum]